MLLENEIRDIIEQRYILPIRDISTTIEKNKQSIQDEFAKATIENNKAEMLLTFRRALEMLVKSDLLLTVSTLTNDQLIAVRKENFLQLVDDRYYTPIHLSSFMDIFKIETKNFNNLSGQIYDEPHIGLVVNYVMANYTNTFTRFMNRNMEYYYIYEFFYKNGKEIKEILSYLNAYHYSKKNNVQELIIDFLTIQDKVTNIYNLVNELLEKI